MLGSLGSRASLTEGDRLHPVCRYCWRAAQLKSIALKTGVRDTFWATGEQPLHDLEITRTTTNGPHRYCIRNCGKDGAIVAARIASAAGGVSCPPPVRIDVDRHTDSTFFADAAAKLARSYSTVGNSNLLDPRTVVLSSVHRVALYVGEVLHAPVLPLQILSFARNLDEVLQSGVPSIVGTDHDAALLWQWIKPTEPEHFPDAYLEFLSRADNAVLVRATDDGSDCPILGRVGNAYVNATLPRLRPDLWDQVAPRLVEPAANLAKLRQWEWGLPDATVAAARRVWTNLGHDASTFHVLEASTVDLYRMIPRMWENYLARNRVAIHGVALSAYWIAHPGYERFAGLVPLPFYRFSTIAVRARALLKRHVVNRTEECLIRAFATDVGSKRDSAEIATLLAELELTNRAWFTTGLDSPGARCLDAFGEEVPQPHEKVRQWIQTTPYRETKWGPLALSDVVSRLASFAPASRRLSRS